jgi:hypothetical protein
MVRWNLFPTPDSSRLNRRFGLAGTALVATLMMTMVTPMMKAETAHKAAMMPTMVAAQRVNGFAPSARGDARPTGRLLGGRGLSESGPG